MIFFVDKKKVEFELADFHKVKHIHFKPIMNTPDYISRDLIIKTDNAKISIRLFTDNPKNLEISGG